MYLSFFCKCHKFFFISFDTQLKQAQFIVLEMRFLKFKTLWEALASLKEMFS